MKKSISSIRILVIGGGVAGLCFARQFAARGGTVTIWEKRHAPETGGYAVGVWKNGFDVLKQFGLDEVVRQAGTASAWSLFSDESGQAVRFTDLSQLNEKYGETVVFMRRGALCQLLLPEPHDLGISLRLGVTAVSIIETPSGVRVRNSSGEEEEFDLVIGADGIRSAVRTMLFGQDTGVIRHNAAFYWAVVDTKRWPERLAGDVEMSGPGTLLGLYPISSRQCGVYASVCRRPQILQENNYSVIRRYFGHFGGFAPLAVAGCEEASIFSDVISEVRLSRWHTSRCMLIGDAAHAMLPTAAQGASVAMEDGYILADLVAGAADAHEKWPRLFAEFQTSRRRRISPVARRAALSNFVINRTPGWLCPMRNSLIRLVMRCKAGGLDNFFRDNPTKNPLELASLEKLRTKKQ